MPGTKSLGQMLTAEEEARLLRAMQNQPPWLPPVPKPTVSASASVPKEDLVFCAEESIPLVDWNELPKEERAKVENHIKGNLGRRVIEQLCRTDLIQFSETKDPQGRRKVYCAELRVPVAVHTPLQGPRFDVSVWDEIPTPAKPPEPQPPEPKAPSEADLAKMRTDVRREARAKALADVAKALDEVEANLIPGADAGFVVLLLRDKLGLDT